MKASLLAAALASPAVVSGMTRVQVPPERVQSDRQLEVSDRALSATATHAPSSPPLASFRAARELMRRSQEWKQGDVDDRLYPHVVGGRQEGGVR